VNKNNLVLLATDQAWRELELPDLATVDWRTSATTMAGDLYAMFPRHSA
jgi:hypothetical protein